MKLFIFLMMLFCFGCATELTPEGLMVRQIQPDWEAKCKFMGVIEETEYNGLDIADSKKGALNKIRNRAAIMGGNAFVINIIERAGFGNITVQADIYKCPN